MTLNKKIETYVIIASLKSETIVELITRIPGSRLLISSLSGSVSRMHVGLLGKVSKGAKIRNRYNQVPH